ncbi:PD40 domain-containing protein [Streptomyces sp. CB01881]|uniref:PD40 domain-containing protein n=1 Tax=Streptomyces sp. CB01881 TaxID=2078691 RepID=UPI000CDC0939|nr:PD40 domain-containing protein [Streptomyces sp. CB01881]AUY48717.1 hypothetical protein C2142_06920 [Streptomyces sp. CB01881]TYC77208.1 hypothetical protein EH183_06925 [Streptomyces sp. CB01881]
MTGTRQLPITHKARTRARAGAGLLLAGAMLTGCGAEPGEIPLSEIRAETPSATPTPEPAAGLSAPTAGAVVAAASTRHNGQIAGRVFLDTTRTTSAVFTVAPDGTGEHQLTQPPARTRDDHPDWSPDGTTLAFDRTDDESAGRIWTIGADGANARQVGPLCEAGAPDCTNEQEITPAFSPDGRQIAFSRAWGAADPAAGQIQYSDVYVMSPDGTNVQRLTFLTNDKPYSGLVTNPSWSPDGKQLVFSYQTSATGQPANGRALYLVNADGTGLRRLTPWELRAGDRANWSPDGSQIIFTTYPAGPENTPGGGIYTVHPDGTAIGALTPGPSDVLYGVASYSPDGASIAYAQAPLNGTAELYTMKNDGSNAAPVTSTPDRWETRPAWGTAVAP